jgi:hypothetical protein
MNTTATMTPAQVEVMNMMSFVKTKNSWQNLKEALAEYFAKQLDSEISSLWDNGTLTDESVQKFSTLHERTPYK